MTRSAYILRLILYVELSILPVLIAGYSNRTAYVLVALNCLYQSGLTIRAFIDTSRSEVKPDAKSTASPIAAA